MIIPKTETALVRAHLDAMIQAAPYPCVGAKAALAHNGIVHRHYASMESQDALAQLAVHLSFFLPRPLPAHLTSFVATFAGPLPRDHAHFSDMLWHALLALRRLDFMPYDPTVSRILDDPDFAFSFAGRGAFIVGLWPGSPRPARRFPWPALLFNRHDQFTRLRARGQFERMRDVIRARDEALTGAPNPLVADHGLRSEAEQYSGLAPDAAIRHEWEVLHNRTDN